MSYTPPTSHEIKLTFGKFIKYVNEHHEKLRVNEPDLFDNDTQQHLKELIKMWNHKDPQTQILIDIKEHHKYINWLDRKTEYGALWWDYVTMTQKLRVKLFNAMYKHQKGLGLI